LWIEIYNLIIRCLLHKKKAALILLITGNKVKSVYFQLDLTLIVRENIDNQIKF
jgi:hypothetical protein